MSGSRGSLAEGGGVTTDPRRDLVVTLDVGTTAVKAAVWDPALSAPLALVRDEYGLITDGETVEEIGRASCRERV